MRVKVPDLYKSLVMVAPSWKSVPPKTWLSRMGPEQAAYWMGVCSPGAASGFVLPCGSKHPKQLLGSEGHGQWLSPRALE